MKNSQKKFRSLALIGGVSTLLLMLPTGINYFGANKSAYALKQPTQLSQAQLQQLAFSITVKVISGDDNGSGILIKKEGQVYTVLTNQHVLEASKTTQIQTLDGKIYPANIVNLQGKDLALLQFRASANYTVATLANISTVAVNDPIYAVGFPSTANSSQKTPTFTKGQVLYVPKQAFKEGYQIGYSNEIEKGMSGGAILNSQGQVIGINGIHAYPLWGNPYIYENGQQPSDAERDLISRYSWGIPIQTFARLAPQYASSDALPAAKAPSNTTLPLIANEVNNTAKKITVQIKWPEGNGSGVIISKDKNTYYVLTAEHVVRNKTDIEVITHDNKQYLVKVDENSVKTLQGIDLAVLKFTSNEDYEVATLARHNLERQGGLVFVYGWSGKKQGNLESSPLFTVGNLFNKDSGVFLAQQSTSLNLGYGLVYTNITQAGVSGGPVLDVRGHVIGIHGRADGDYVVDEAAPGYGVQLGYSLGIPVSTFIEQLPKTGINPEQLNVYKLKPPTLTYEEKYSILKALLQPEKPINSQDALVWLNYGNQYWRRFDYDEALTAFDKAIKLKPELYQAWYARGITLLEEQKYQEALEAFDKAIQSSKQNFAPAWRGRGQALHALNRFKEALESFDKAIALDDGYYIVRVWRGDVLQALGCPDCRSQALQAYNEAIKIKPHPLAFNRRGSLYASLGKRDEAIADYNKAIEISYINRSSAKYTWEDKEAAFTDADKAVEVAPNYVNAYIHRGLIRYEQKNKDKAIADFSKAIQIDNRNPLLYLYLAYIYNNQEDYQEAIAYYTKAIEIYPYLPEAFYGRGYIYRKNGNQKGAIDDLQQAANLYKQRGNVNSYKQIVAIIEQFKRTASAFSQSNQFTTYEGRAFNITHKLPGRASIKIFETDKSSGKVRVLITMSKGLYGEGELEGKIQNHVIELSGVMTRFGADFFDTKIRLEYLPDNTIKGTYVIYAGANNSAGRDQNGEFTFTKVNEASLNNTQAELKPKDAQAYFKKGESRQNIGDFIGAVINYSEAIKLKTDYVEAYYNRAISFIRQGELKKAIEDLSAVIRLRPDAVEAYYFRALSYGDLKQYKEAILDFDQILRPQEFSGIGVQTEINAQTKIITVTRVVENSPAQKQGIKAGDQILAVDGQSTTSKTLEQIIQMIRGTAGTKVSLQIARPRNNNLKITLTRSPNIIDTKYADAYYYRGIARAEIKDKQGARRDYQIAAELYQKQGKQNEYQQALAKINELQ